MTTLEIRTDRVRTDLTSTDRIRTGRPTVLDAQGTAMLLMNEALARSRHREAEEVARDHRVARRLAAERRWSRLAAYADRRARRARGTD
ncbi:hypothetical protein GCM10009836_23410 [Pseudonocardia ailaonensis]|uniref:ANTAR domain-containing protein n=1 Tax=Pseudonocardia ailaonensis TaxID=367279 RepID=A0ABN2N0R6_9PSEU